MFENTPAPGLGEIRRLLEDGRVVEVSALIRTRLSQDPHDGEALFLMAQVARIAGNLEIALSFLTSTLGHQPNRCEFLVEKAEVLEGLGRVKEAMSVHRDVLRHDPKNFPAHAALGRGLTSQSEFEDACIHLRAAIRLHPETMENHLFLGGSLVELGRFPEAESAFLEGLEVHPNNIPILLRLASLYRQRSQPGPELATLRRAVAAEPDNPGVLSNLGVALLERGELDEAIACFRKALDQKPDESLTHSNLLAALNYQDGIPRRTIAAAHADWGRQHANHLASDQSALSRADASPDRPLRLGFVSADFCHHPVGRFAEAVFRHLDPDSFELFVYHNAAHRDAVTRRLESIVGQWRKTSALTDQEMANLIQQDRIDVLVDLSGHMSGHRLLVFARRPAPIQVTLFAYPNTTSVKAIDYRITDEYSDPEGTADEFYSEHLVRLANTAWVYTPPDCGTTPRPRVPRARNEIVFGCLNNPGKISAACARLWSRILGQLPEARLMLLTRDDFHTDRILGRFHAAGARKGQLWLVSQGPLERYLECHHEIDLMLDPFPYNGGVTTCDALWMGVPVLTLAGDTYASRQGVSTLMNVGLPELIAEGEGQFLEKAVRMAGSSERLAELRSQLRERLQRSPLMDYKSYALELGKSFQMMWLKWLPLASGGRLENSSCDRAARS